MAASIWVHGYEIPLAGLLLVIGGLKFVALFWFLFWGKTRKKAASVKTAPTSD